MKLKSTLADYTAAQFTAVIQSIKDCEGPESVQAELIEHLNSLAAGAGGSDLIYYPEEGSDNSAEGVVQTIQAWCVVNGFPGFKPRF